MKSHEILDEDLLHELLSIILGARPPVLGVGPARSIVGIGELARKFY